MRDDDAAGGPVGDADGAHEAGRDGPTDPKQRPLVRPRCDLADRGARDNNIAKKTRMVG